MTGVAGLSADAWPALLPWSPMSLHATFGVSLLSMVLVSFRKEILGARLNETTARGLCRDLSRTVYLILYLVFGADQMVRLSWNTPVFKPPENLRDYFVYGLVALLAIRGLTVLSVRRPPARRMNPQLVRAADAAAPQ